MLRPFLAVLAILSPASVSSLFAQSNNLFVGPSTLTFSGVTKGIPTGTQFISASSSSTPIALNVTVEYLSGDGWLFISPNNGFTPLTVSVYANPANIATPGTYSARVNFFGSFGGTVFVSFAVSSAGGASTLTANPSSFTLNASAAGGPITQQLSINSATSGVGYNVTTSTASGGNWLTNVYPATGVTPSSLSFTLDPTGLFSQSYTGSIIITPTNAGTALTIPVTLSVNGVTSGFTLSASTIPVNYQIGTAYPSPQTIFVNNSGGQISYNASSSTSWALLSTAQNPSPASTVTGLTGSSLSVNINPAGLTTGTYSSNITVTSSAGQTLYATVTLSVSNSGFFNPSPNTLTFNYIPGSATPASQTVSVTSSTGASINFSASASSNGGWLYVSPLNGNTTTSNLLTVSIQQVSLATGTYSGTITLTDAFSGVTSTIPVTLNYGVSGGTNQLSISPSTLFFQSPVNSLPVTQNLQISAFSGVSQNFQVAASSTNNWLSVAPGVGVTPATITAVASSLLVPGPGTYTGNIVFTNFDGTQQTLPVTFNVTTNVNLLAVPNSVAFSQAVGAPAPAAQTIQISAASGPSTAFSVTTNAAWLTATPNAGTTPATVTIAASAGNLTQGTYSAVVTIAGGANQLTVPVSFTVLPANSLTLSSTSINFNYQAGTAAPATQVINVSSTGGASVPFIAAVATFIGGNWLTISQNANSTPATLTVSVNPVSLASGIYPGTITILASDGSGQKITVNVTLTVTAPPAPQINKVLHAATNQSTWLAPGLIIVIQGIGLGPAIPVAGTLLAPGAVDTIAGGTRVLFDGVPAPIVAAKSDSILTVVPYVLRGKITASMVVEYQGIQSAPITMSVFDSAPGLFTRDGSGVGQAAIDNENGAPNSPANPAAPGSVVSIFGTGEGDTRPIGQDGRLIVTDLRVPILPVRFYLNGRELEILYAGSAPGFVSGAFQVNVRIPDNLPFSGSVPIELQVGTRASQTSITIAIR